MPLQNAEDGRAGQDGLGKSKKNKGKIRDSCIFVIQGVGRINASRVSRGRRRIAMLLWGRVCMMVFLMALGPEFRWSAPGSEAQAAASKGAHVEKAAFGQTADGRAIESYTIYNSQGASAKLIT